MTSLIPFLLCAVPDLTLAAMHKGVVRQTSIAFDLFYRKVLTVRKNPFAGNFSLVEVHQSLLELRVMITVCHVNGTDAAIKTTRGNEIRIDHKTASQVCVVVYHFSSDSKGFLNRIPITP
jgi:hypothetical protein